MPLGGRHRGESMGPVLLLLIAAAVPAFGLGYLWRWSEARIPDDDKKAEQSVITEPRLPAALATPLLSVRRAPDVLATMSSEGTIVSALNAMAPAISDGSCLTVQLDGRTIFDKGGTTPVVPASNEKLLTAAVALETLGADYTFTTKLFGTVVDGAVEGDMFLLGGGDPLLSTGAYPPTVLDDPPTNVTALEVLVFQMAQAGITRVNGNVIGDESRYDNERFVPTWSEEIKNGEAGPLGALLVNDATQRFATGRSAPRRYADPALGAATDLIALLKGAGIRVSGRPLAGITPLGTPDITAVTSLPLSAIIGEMLTTSDDNTAEMLLKELGFHASGFGTRQGGIDVVRTALAGWGIDTTPLNIIDGSGLDSGNTVTCNLLLQVLQHQPLDGPIGAGLPIAGQTGSLANTFVGTSVAGRMHAKTGTLNNAKALTGFVTTTAGTLEFSMVLSGPNVSDPFVFQPVWDQLAAALGPYPSGPPADALGPR